MENVLTPLGTPDWTIIYETDFLDSIEGQKEAYQLSTNAFLFGLSETTTNSCLMDGDYVLCGSEKYEHHFKRLIELEAKLKEVYLSYLSCQQEKSEQYDRAYFHICNSAFEADELTFEWGKKLCAFPQELQSCPSLPPAPFPKLARIRTPLRTSVGDPPGQKQHGVFPSESANKDEFMWSLQHVPLVCFDCRVDLDEHPVSHSQNEKDFQRDELIIYAASQGGGYTVDKDYTGYVSEKLYSGSLYEYNKIVDIISTQLRQYTSTQNIHEADTTNTLLEDHKVMAHFLMHVLGRTHSGGLSFEKVMEVYSQPSVALCCPESSKASPLELVILPNVCLCRAKTVYRVSDIHTVEDYWALVHAHLYAQIPIQLLQQMIRNHKSECVSASVYLQTKLNNSYL
eukprot:Platyproteum_vivax@DN1817_c0_g1_i1.p1